MNLKKIRNQRYNHQNFHSLSLNFTQLHTMQNFVSNKPTEISQYLTDKRIMKPSSISNLTLAYMGSGDFKMIKEAHFPELAGPIASDKNLVRKLDIWDVVKTTPMAHYFIATNVGGNEQANRLFNLRVLNGLSRGAFHNAVDQFKEILLEENEDYNTKQSLKQSIASSTMKGLLTRKFNKTKCAKLVIPSRQQKEEMQVAVLKDLVAKGDYNTICKLRYMSKQCTINLKFEFAAAIGGINMYVFPKQKYSTSPIDDISCLKDHVNGMTPAIFTATFGRFAHEDVRRVICFYIPMIEYRDARIVEDGVPLVYSTPLQLYENRLVQIELLSAKDPKSALFTDQISVQNNLMAPNLVPIPSTPTMNSKRFQPQPAVSQFVVPAQLPPEPLDMARQVNAQQHVIDSLEAQRRARQPNQANQELLRQAQQREELRSQARQQQRRQAEQALPQPMIEQQVPQVRPEDQQQRMREQQQQIQQDIQNRQRGIIPPVPGFRDIQEIASQNDLIQVQANLEEEKLDLNARIRMQQVIVNYVGAVNENEVDTHEKIHLDYLRLVHWTWENEPRSEVLPSQSDMQTVAQNLRDLHAMLQRYEVSGQNSVMAARCKILSDSIAQIGGSDQVTFNAQDLCAAQRLELEARFFPNYRYLKQVKKHNFDNLLESDGLDSHFRILGEVIDKALEECASVQLNDIDDIVLNTIAYFVYAYHTALAFDRERIQKAYDISNRRAQVIRNCMRGEYPGSFKVMGETMAKQCEQYRDAVAQYAVTAEALKAKITLVQNSVSAIKDDYTFFILDENCVSCNHPIIGKSCVFKCGVENCSPRMQYHYGCGQIFLSKNEPICPLRLHQESMRALALGSNLDYIDYKASTNEAISPSGEVALQDGVVQNAVVQNADEEEKMPVANALAGNDEDEEEPINSQLLRQAASISGSSSNSRFGSAQLSSQHRTSSENHSVHSVHSQNNNRGQN